MEKAAVIIPEPVEKDFWQRHTGLNSGTFIIIFAGILIFVGLLISARALQIK